MGGKTHRLVASSIEDLGQHNPQIPHERGYVGETQVGVDVVASRAVVDEAHRGESCFPCGEDVVTRVSDSEAVRWRDAELIHGLADGRAGRVAKRLFRRHGPQIEA